MKTKIKAFTFFFASAFLFIATLNYVEAFGISPTKLFLSDNEEGYFYIYNEKDNEIKLYLFSEDSYLDFQKSINVNANNISKVAVKPYENLSSGFYKTKIYIVENSINDGVSINKALALLANINVSKDINTNSESKIPESKILAKDTNQEKENKEFSIQEFEDNKSNKNSKNSGLKILEKESKSYQAGNGLLELFQILLLITSICLIFVNFI